MMDKSFTNIRCKGCGKHPNELNEYIREAQIKGTTPTAVVINEEGTYNPVTGLFYCTKCYIKAGMPEGKA